jgi:hypothetical protein
LCKDELSAVVLSLPLAAICTIAAALGYEVIELPLLRTMKRLVLRKRQTPSQQPSVMVG